METLQQRRDVEREIAEVLQKVDEDVKQCRSRLQERLIEIVKKLDKAVEVGEKGIVHDGTITSEDGDEEMEREHQ